MKQAFDSLPSKKTYAISELLPYQPQVKLGPRLLSGLREYLLIIYALETTLCLIEQKKIGCFDPLVGENACQIRAVKIYDIMNSFEFNQDLYKKITHAKEKIRFLIAEEVFKKDKKKSLYDFIIMDNLDINIDEDLIFLLRSYLLTKAKLLMPSKEETPLFDNLITKPKLLQDICFVSIVHAEKFIKKLRADLSKDSVDYVRNLGAKLRPNEIRLQMISEQYSIRYIGLLCIPYYWTTQILIKHLLNQKVPILLSAEQRAIDRNYQTIIKTKLYFEVTPAGYKKKERIDDLDKLAIIVHGTSNVNFLELLDQSRWSKKLEEYGIINLILAHAASHRQYPDEAQELILQNIHDQDFFYYKTKADLWGCSIKNPSLFFITHIFCERIGNIIKQKDIYINQMDERLSESIVEENAAV